MTQHEKALSRLIVAEEPEILAKMILESEEAVGKDRLLTLAVLSFLSLENLRDANRAFDVFKVRKGRRRQARPEDSACMGQVSHSRQVGLTFILSTLPFVRPPRLTLGRSERSREGGTPLFIRQFPASSLREGCCPTL